MIKGNFKKEGAHLYECITDRFGQQSWVHCYQNAAYEKNTESNFDALIYNYQQYDDQWYADLDRLL
jgi:hypothetical protein